MQTFAFVMGMAVDNAMSFQAKESALSELAKTSKELERKNIALELSSQRERDLLDVLGHELRTPLSIIKNALELMALKKKKGILKDEDIDKNIAAASESLEREIRIIETILGATKLASKMLELHFEKVDIIDVVNDGIAAQKGTASKKGIEIDFKSPEPSFPSVYADRTKIQEVFDNLLSNSIKYTRKGKITIMLKESEDLVSLSVKDTGVGIPKKEIEKLGTKFYRVQQYLEKEGKMKMVRPGGSGLGLYVTFGYVKAMGGKMTVESKVGKGSTFTFTVPKYKGQKPSGYKKQEKDVFKRLGLEKS
jgi:signal transduction histidine kinase